MNSEDVGYVGHVVLNLSIFLLLIAVYTYIGKLEHIGCECAAHPKRDFIKYFSIFALIMLSVIMVVPMQSVIRYFGFTVAVLYALVKFVFYTVCIVFFFMTLDYTRFLISEKCKCSDDYRKELIYVGSIIEISILFLIFLVIVILPVLMASISGVLSGVKMVSTKYVTPFVKKSYKNAKSMLPKMKSMPKFMRN